MNKNHESQPDKTVRGDSEQENKIPIPELIKRIKSKTAEYSEQLGAVASLDEKLVDEMVDLAEGNRRLNTMTTWDKVGPQEREAAIKELVAEGFKNRAERLKQDLRLINDQKQEIEKVLALPFLRQEEADELEKLGKDLDNERVKIEAQFDSVEGKGKNEEFERVYGEYQRFFGEQEDIAQRPIEFAVKTVLATYGDELYSQGTEYERFQKLYKTYLENPEKTKDFQDKVQIEIARREEISKFTAGLESFKKRYAKYEDEIVKARREFEEGKKKLEEFWETHNEGSLTPLLREGADFFQSTHSSLFSDDKNRAMDTMKEDLKRFVPQTLKSVHKLIKEGVTLNLFLPVELQEEAVRLYDQNQQLQNKIAELKKERDEFFIRSQHEYIEWRQGVLKREAEYQCNQELMRFEATCTSAEKEVRNIDAEFEKFAQSVQEERDNHRKAVDQLKADIDESAPKIEEKLKGIFGKKKKAQEASLLLNPLGERWERLKYPATVRTSVLSELEKRLNQSIQQASDIRLRLENEKARVQEPSTPKTIEFPLSGGAQAEVTKLQERVQKFFAYAKTVKEKIKRENTMPPYSHYNYLILNIPFNRLDILRTRINDMLR